VGTDEAPSVRMVGVNVGIISYNLSLILWCNTQLCLCYITEWFLLDKWVHSIVRVEVVPLWRWRQQVLWLVVCNHLQVHSVKTQMSVEVIDSSEMLVTWDCTASKPRRSQSTVYNILAVYSLNEGP
jgi:hypothetical protein